MVLVEVMNGPAETATVDLDGGFAVDEDVILDEVVASAADESGAAGAIEEVAVDRDAAAEIVEIDAAYAVEAGADQVVKVVEAYDGSARGVVASNVDGADVTGFFGDMVDFVVFDEVVVAFEEERHVGRVVDEVVGSSVSDAFEGDGGIVGAVDEAEIVEVVVDDVVVSSFEGCPIATGEGDAACVDLLEVAVAHAAVVSAVNGDRDSSEGVKMAFGDFHVVRIYNFDSLGTVVGEVQAAEAKVGGIFDAEKRLV